MKIHYFCMVFQIHLQIQKRIIILSIGFYSPASNTEAAYLECKYTTNISYIGARQWKKQKNISRSWFEVDSENEVVRFIGIKTGELYRLQGVRFSSDYIEGIACGYKCNDGYPRGLNRKNLQIIEGGGFGETLVGKCEVIDEEEFNAVSETYKKIKKSYESDNII